MKNKRVAICHETMLHGNAIGNDIMGMCDLLSVLGFEPTIFCDYADGDIDYPGLKADYDVKEIDDYEMVIYHHSIFWEKGETFLAPYHGTLLFKYHNIPPPCFFDPYSSTYEGLCAAGILQTKRFVNSETSHYWLADS